MGKTRIMYTCRSIVHVYMAYACVFGSINVCQCDVDHHDVMQYDVMTFNQ